MGGRTAALAIACRRLLEGVAAETTEVMALDAAADAPSTEPPNHFLCAISHEVMTDPVLAADGMTYERRAIEHWLRKNDTSPSTNSPLADKTLRPNHMIKELCQQLFPDGK